MTPVDPLAPLRELPRELIPSAVMLLAARLAEPVAAPAAAPIGDRMLTVDEVVERLGSGTSRKWVYRHREELGAVKLSHSKLGIPESRLAAYLAAGGT
jgi:hypothetical protein